MFEFPGATYFANLSQGHVFCHDCIWRAIQATKSRIPQHQCPVCNKLYSTGNLFIPQLVCVAAFAHIAWVYIVNVDPELIPDRLKLHMLPSIRTLHFPPVIDIKPDDHTRDTAEIMSLKSQRRIMQWRAGVHAATISGLTCLAKMARDQAIQMRHERDLMERKYNALKRKVRDDDEQ